MVDESEMLMDGDTLTVTVAVNVCASATSVNETVYVVVTDGEATVAIELGFETLPDGVHEAV